MNRTNREHTRVNHAYGDALRQTIDDVVSADVPLSHDDIVDLVRVRLERTDIFLKEKKAAADE